MLGLEGTRGEYRVSLGVTAARQKSLAPPLWEQAQWKTCILRVLSSPIALISPSLWSGDGGVGSCLGHLPSILQISPFSITIAPPCWRPWSSPACAVKTAPYLAFLILIMPHKQITWILPFPSGKAKLSEMQHCVCVCYSPVETHLITAPKLLNDLAHTPGAFSLLPHWPSFGSSRAPHYFLPLGFCTC